MTRDREKKGFLQSLKSGPYLDILKIGVFSILLFFIIISKLDTGKLDLKVGEESPIEVRANKEIVDKKATDDLKKDIVNRNEKIYRKNPSVQTSMKRTVSDFFYNVKKAKEMEDLNLNDKIDYLSKESRVNLTREEYKAALYLSDKELDSFSLTIDDLINQIMGTGVSEGELPRAKEEVERAFSDLDLDPNETKLGISIVNNIIQPNKFYDQEETQKNLEAKLETLEPVTIKEHQVIVKKGELVTEMHLKILRDLGILRLGKGYDGKVVIGLILLLFMFELALFAYINIFNREVFNSNKLTILLIVILSTILISFGIYNISAYLMPVMAAAMIISVIIDTRLAILVNILLSFILTYTLKLESTVFAMYVISGTLGSYTIKKSQQRYDALLNGIFVGLVNLVLIVAFGLLKKVEMKEMFLIGVYGLINGLFSGVLTIGTLPIWENFFKIITPLKLLELSNPNQPLLKRLLLEAPGTYHHSIMVGNLGERAAEAIGANGLLARTAAYYHDIGKLKRPMFFKENQIGMANPHDNIDPIRSAKIILNHVTDGSKLARDNDLPKEIIDILEQHHGTTSVMYFYYKAREENPDIDPEEFIYRGPKPQTKEAAIVMLADSTEAAVRSIKEPDEDKVKEMISNIFKSKLEANQFDECDITFREINITYNTFIDTFLGMYHERIEYPDIKELK